jgi:hypothetical protein
MWPPASLCIGVSVCSPIAARQRGLLFNKKRDQPFNVGALTEQSSGPAPPPPYSQTETEYCQSQSQSQSQLLYEWQFTADQFVLASSPLRLMTSDLIFQLNTCGYSPYVTSSLTRGSVCHLKLLLVLASAVILRSEFRGTHDHILLSQIRDAPQPWGPGPRIYIPQEQGGPVIFPGTEFPFHRLLRLAGLRWRYSTPPPHSIMNWILSVLKVYVIHRTRPRGER